MTKTIAGAALALMLLTTACGGTEEDVPASEDASTESASRPRPLSQTDPEAYKMDPGTAMREAPEAIRADVQRAIVCVVEKARKDTGTAAINADTIRSVTRHITNGGSTQDYCNT